MAELLTKPKNPEMEKKATIIKEMPSHPNKPLYCTKPG